MKKILLSIAALVGICTLSNAQVVTTIGVGTATAMGSNYLPIYRSTAASSFDYSRAYFLYTAAELTAAGIPPGSTITQIEWDKTNVGATITSTSNVVFNVLMKNTLSTGYTVSQDWGTLSVGATPVYTNNAQVIPATTGFLPFPLTSPFVYTGNSLEILTDWDISAVSGSPTTAGFAFRYSVLAGRTGGNSNSTPLLSTTLMSTQSNRPNIRITYTLPPPCSGMPVAGMASVSNSIICASQNIDLFLSGYSAASGLSFQWMVSSDGVSGWAAVPSATAAAATVSVTSTSYYMCAVACGTDVATSSTVSVMYGTTPTAGASASTFTTICAPQNVNLSLTGATSYPGMTYQWLSSPTGSGYTPITTATLATRTESVLATTYYQNLLTCGTGTALSSPVMVSIALTTTNTVPYFEGFEGISMNNQLPNCSWVASNLPTICRTYTAATGSYNQKAKTGNKYGSFRYGTNTAGDYFYTNGILLNAGTTYYASADYITDGGAGWSNFSLLYGTTQTTTALTAIASATGALTNTVYANINGTFSVSATGIYYVAVKAIGTSAPWYLSFDDLLITTCAPPTSVTVNSVAQTSLNVTWGVPATGSPANYVYEIRTAGAAGSGTTGLATTGTVTAPTTSVTVTGLSPLTAYTVYVMGDCGSGSLSSWTAPTTFTTLANCPVPTSLTISAITPTSAVSSWTAGGAETQWDIYYGPATSVPTATTVPTATATATSYTLSPLTPSTSYSVYVRSNCGAGTTSIWTPVAAFATPCLPPDVLTTTGNTRCGIGTTTLGATTTGGATLQWYANPTGGAAIGTGSVFTTPTITTTTNYYVTSTGGLSTSFLGKASTLGTDGTNTSGAYLIFDAFSNFTLNSVVVYPSGTGAGTVVIALQNSTGTTLQTATVSVTGSATAVAQTVPVNFNITPGTAYRLVYLSSTGGVTALYRDFSGATFPYTLSGVTSITNGSIGGYYYYFYNWSVSSGCESARTMVTATVTAPPAVTLSTPAAICAGSGIATLSVTSTVSDFTSYVWTPTVGLYTDAAATTAYTGGNASTVYVNSASVGTLNFMANATNTVTGCANIATTSVTTKEAPTSLTVTGTPNPLCTGSTVSLTATANSIPVTLFTEDFNGTSSAFTNTNLTTTTGTGTVSLAAWTLRNSPYACGVGTISSNDLSQFYLTDADVVGSGSNTRTFLQSPAINTTGMTTLNLNFYHYYNYYNTSDSAKVEVSTNGVTWSTLVNYSTGAVDIGTPSSFVPVTLNLNAYVGFPTLYVRYRYSSTWGYGWAIDNFRLSGTSLSDYSYAWTSAPAGFTSTISNPTNTPTTTTTYSVVITNTATSCSNTGAVTVTVNPLPTVVASSSSSLVCAGLPVTLTAATTATTINWSTGATAATTIANPTVATVYTASVTSSAGCVGTSTVSVNINALPTVTASSTSSAICVGSTATLTAATTETVISWNTGATTASISTTPTLSTVYTVSVTNTNGCVKTATTNVTVNALPTVTVSASNATICAGSAVGLNAATTASLVNWSNGATGSLISASPMLTTVYTATVTDGNGCVKTGSVNVNVNPKPNVTISTTNSVICDGNTVVLTASTSATSYTWNTGATTASISITPTVATNYMVNVTDANGCTGNASILIIVNPCTGIEENQNFASINIYPNPNNGIVNVTLTSALAQNSTLEIYDAIGKLVVKQALTSELNTINISDLNNGMYMFKVINNTKTVKFGKIIKQ